MQRLDTPPPIPDRPSDAHKGTFGRVFLVGGSRGMSGAIALSGLAALRGGAGLVYLAVPREIAPLVSTYEPAYQVRSLPQDTEGGLSFNARGPLQGLLEPATSVGVGPGLGAGQGGRQLVRWLVTSADRPMVLDADGLNALAAHADLWADAAEPPQWPAPRVVTPHPGEFSRLINQPIGEIQSRREELAAQFAREANVICVLKGAGTVVTDGERVFVNQTGNSGLATGGTGDVLTGLLAALLARDLSPFDAACLATHLHGLAGDLAAADLSEPGLIASDLPLYVARAWRVMSDRRRKTD